MNYVIDRQRKLIYSVRDPYLNYHNDQINQTTVEWELNLVAHWDYTAPDYNDVQGYVIADGSDSIFILQHIIDETLKDVLADEGLEFIKGKLPDIYLPGVHPRQLANLD